MKDPVKTHEEHGERIDEIFGRIRKLFKPSQSTNPKTFLDAMKRYQETDASDQNCKDLDTGKKLNKIAAGRSGSSEVKIGTNTIKNIKGLRFEIIGANNKGTGKFNNALVDDFRCYDINTDPYGIGWLFARNAEYIAEYISGDLKYLGNNTAKKTQSVSFVGEWTKGTFYGTFMGGEWGGEARIGAGAKFINQTRPTGKKYKTTKGKQRKTRPRQQAAAATTTPAPAPSTAPAATPSATPGTATVGTSGAGTPAPARPSAKKGKITIKESEKA